MDYTIKDSSIWQSPESHSKINRRDHAIRAGIVRQEFFDEREEELETKYIVDIIEPGGQYPVVCRRMVSYGGPFNYEEFTRQTYDERTDGSGKGDFRTRPGDHVLVAYVDGDDKEGVIIGSLKHPSRTETLPAENKVAYASEFNGLETTITDEGEWQIRFRGQPTNLSALSQPPTEADIIAPVYNEAVGNSFFKIDATGSWEMGDAATIKPQLIKIDKPGGTITITSGDTVLTLSKLTDEFTLVNKKTNFNSLDEFNIATKKFKLLAQKAEITAQKIESRGQLKHLGTVESTGPFKITGPVEVLGPVSTTGPVSLGGGAGGGLPAIQQILLIIGTGNLGLPVISAPTVLTSQLTVMV